MENKYKNVICFVLIGVMILSVCTFIVINKKDSNNTNTFEEEIIKEEKIPEIKEDYSETSFININEYDKKVIFDRKSNEIRLDSNEENIAYYIIGKDGKMYNTKISIEKENDSNNIIFGNYKILYDDETFKYYYINTDTKTVSLMYDTIIPIYFQNNIVHYLLLINDETNYILNINTDDLVTLDDEIVYVKIDNEENKIGSDKYLIYKDKNDLYGLIDFNGNIIINPIYEELDTYNTSKTFIARKDKKYGIIEVNNKNNIINFEYDLILYNKELVNYLVLCKNNKIGVLYNNKLIVNYKIDYNLNDEISIKNIDNNLYINTNNYLYKINTKGIEKSIEGTYYEILDYEDNLKYFYKLNENETSIDLHIYDKDLYEYFNTTLNYKKQYYYSLDINNIENTNYYKVSIDYDVDSNDIDETYYIDLYNSKMISEKNALIKYFDNGYSYILNNNVLNVYKENELLNTYNDVVDYLGNYYFLVNKDNKYFIEELVFKKESN